MNELERASWHESGHCCMALRFHRPVRCVWITEAGAGNTDTGWCYAPTFPRLPRELHYERCREQLYISLAGPVSEALAVRSSVDLGDDVDVQRAGHWLLLLRAEHQPGWDEAVQETRRLLTEPATAAQIRAVAQALVRRRYLSAAEIRELL